MGRENEVASLDAAEVGLALALPAGLRSHIEAILAISGPVEQAVAAGWTGMDSVRLVTADVNGSVGWPRMIGVSRARTLLDGEPGERASPGRAHPSVNESEMPIPPQNSATFDASAHVDSRHVDGGLTVDGGVAPVPSEDGDGGLAAHPGSWSVDLSHDAAVAPLIVKAERDAWPEDDRGGPERSIAPVMVRVVRGAASKAGAERTGMLDVPFGDAGEVNAVAPVTGDGASGARMRADVVAALRARAFMYEVVADDQASSPFPVGQDAHRTAVGGKIARGSTASDTRSSALGWGGSGGSIAQASPERGAGGAGEALSGHIMLDGHTVGAWMSSRMARDAARPGAGATSFDPRQAPAWTPSGAL